MSWNSHQISEACDELTEPVIDPEVWKEVPNTHVGPAEGATKVHEHGSCDGDADVTDQNQLCVAVLVQRAARVEMVDTTCEAVLLANTAAFALALVEVVASDIGDEVLGPAHNLLADEHQKTDNGCLLGQLSDLVKEATNTVGELLASAGHKDHVPLHVASGLVVLAVGNLPAEVWDEQGGMDQPAGDVANGLGRRKGTVATLMGNHPETSTKQALGDGIDCPEKSPDGSGRDVLGSHVCVKDVESGGEARNIPQDVGPASKGGALEAVLGDGIVDVLDRVVGRGEVVAVRVDETAVLGLGRSLVDRGQGG